MKFIIILVNNGVHLARINSQGARSGEETSMTHFVFWCIVVLSTRSVDRNYVMKELEAMSGNPYEIYLEDWEITFLK